MSMSDGERHRVQREIAELERALTEVMRQRIDDIESEALRQRERSLLLKIERKRQRLESWREEACTQSISISSYK